MKRRLSLALTMVIIFFLGIHVVVSASDVSLCDYNTAYVNSSFLITETGNANVSVSYTGKTNVTTGAVITIKIEKRSFLLFWSDVVDETITVSGTSYMNTLNYQLEDTGTYRCTVVYTISGTGGPDDVITYEGTAKYE